MHFPTLGNLLIIGDFPLTLLRMVVHLDQGTSTANICETLVTKYEFSQNARQKKKRGGGT